jgi:hypothetical protein
MLIHLPERLLICIEQDKGPSDSEVIVFWHSQFYIYHKALVDEYTHTYKRVQSFSKGLCSKRREALSHPI